MRMRVTFDEISRADTIHAKCDRCGGKAQRTIRVTHTVNPYNRNADGVPRTPEEVLAQVKDVLAFKVKQIRASGITCRKCENAGL